MSHRSQNAKSLNRRLRFPTGCLYIFFSRCGFWGRRFGGAVGWRRLVERKGPSLQLALRLRALLDLRPELAALGQHGAGAVEEAEGLLELLVAACEHPMPRFLAGRGIGRLGADLEHGVVADVLLAEVLVDLFLRRQLLLDQPVAELVEHLVRVRIPILRQLVAA